MMMEIVKIPHERVGILIGDKGEIKARVEKECNVTLKISGEGDVLIEGDTSDVFFAKDVVKAIGRGFNPRDALRIIKENYQFFLINLKEYFPNENAMTRIKGRIIGERGKMKEEIESAAECVISIYGNTVGIIAKMDSMEYAKEAISMLMGGSQHASVFTYLADIRRRLLGERLTGKPL